MHEPSDPQSGQRSSRRASAEILRRNVLLGSAWAVPALALTTTTPAFASSRVVLVWDKSSYSAEGCSYVFTAKVCALSGTEGQASLSVTVTLPSGYVFSFGGTSFTGKTARDGSLSLPSIRIPADGTPSVMTATAPGATPGTCTLSGTPASIPNYLRNGALGTGATIYDQSKPIAGTYFLSGNVVINKENGVSVVTGVTKFGQAYWNGTSRILPVDQGRIVVNDRSQAAVGVPAGSAPAAGPFFLATDGRLIDGISGTVSASDVAAFGFIYRNNADTYIPLKKTDGSTSYLKNGQERQPAGVPGGSTPVAGWFFLRPDNALVSGEDGTVRATSVDAFGQLFWDSASWALPLRKQGGSVSVLSNNVETAAVGVPSGSTPIGGAVFLVSDGRLIEGKAGAVYSSNVTSCGQLLRDSRGWTLPIRSKRSSC